MKQVTVIAVLFISAASFVMAGEDYFCKWCGLSFSNPKTLCSGICMYRKDGSRKHEMFQGQTNPKEFMCVYCGNTRPTLRALVTTKCVKHNKGAGFHVAYEGELKGRYICKKCGQSFNNFKTLVNSRCLTGGGETDFHEPKR